MKKEVIFSSLEDAVINKDDLSPLPSEDKWQTMQYTAGDVSGRMVIAGELCHPRDLTVKLGLRGWHKIFVCTVNMKSVNYFCMRLSSDEGFSGMREPSYGKKFMWTPCEYAQEFFWKCANLSDEELIISKPDSHFRNTCTVLWVRCVPMTADETLEYKKRRGAGNVMVHFDEDTNAEDSLDSDEGLLTRFVDLKRTDVNECALEISFDYDTPDHKDIPTLLANDMGWHAGDVAFQKKKAHAYKLRCDFLHENGILAYAANRMSVTEFTPPYTNGQWTYKKFVNEHPKYYCTLRDKSKIAVCSYAYPEVRDYVINTLLSFMKYGFDGLTLIFHRGLHIGFDEPVIDMFSKKYPGLDPFTLPVTDTRLNGIWCDFMTAFMTELRRKLYAKCGSDKRINVVVDYSPETSVHFGLDTEKWARLGLVDGVCQGIMEMYEDLDGVLNDKGRIDLVKYKEKLKREPVLRRYHATDIEKIYEGAKKHLEICDRCGIDFYATLPWPHKVAPEAHAEYIEGLREIGVTKFLSWNTNHLLYDRPEAAAALSHSNATCEMTEVRQHRMTSLSGSNIGIFNPNWRG